MCRECKSECIGNTPCLFVGYCRLGGKKMIKKVILTLFLCLILSGCFKDKNSWETVKLYQVGTEWLFDCSAGCYRLDNPLQFDHNNDKILEVLISGNAISGIKDN